jgi:uncharacterized membrane protein YbhN (UPF0104 family)
VFAFARLATAIPITPGGAGLVEVVLIGGLVAAAVPRRTRIASSGSNCQRLRGHHELSL